MILDFEGKLFNNIKDNKLVKDFIMELKMCLNKIENEKENENIKTESTTFDFHKGNRIISKYRDKMLLQRMDILNEYAKKVLNKENMYYIYSENSISKDSFNLCACDEKKNNLIVVAKKDELPKGVSKGCLLEKLENEYKLLDYETLNVAKDIYNMKSKLLDEQMIFLESKRIEGHIYKMCEKDNDTAWIVDITQKNEEIIEEINFPKILLESSKQGDLFCYNNGEYKKI